MTDRISVQGRDGAFGAYVARPKVLPAPAVVVLHEVFGVNADIRKTCDELAEQGFVAVAPDLFWRQEPGVDLSVTSDPDWRHGLRLYQAYDKDAGARDVKDTADVVAKLPECAGKVAVLGFCLGGLMTFHDDFRPQPGDVVAHEHWGSSGFANTDLDPQLKQHGIRHIILIGMIANTCIESTGRFGMELGYRVTLVKDATAAFSHEAMHAAHAINGPTYAHAIVTTEELLARLETSPQAGLSS